MNDDTAPRTFRPEVFEQAFAGRFIAAAELNGKRPTMTIVDYVKEEIEGEKGKDFKLILAFKETPRRMICNRTNGELLKGMFGSRLVDWLNKRITLFAADWNGQPALRIWGSPDIATDMKLDVKLPRRKPFTMTMHKTVKEAPAAREPGTDDDKS